MAYVNNINNPSFYPSFTSGEFDTYRSPTSAIEQETHGASNTFTNGWNMGAQPSYMVSEPTSLGAETSFGKCGYSPLEGRSLTCASPESMSSVNLRGAQVHCYDQWLYPDYHRSITGQDSQFHRSGIVNQDNSFASTVALEDSTVIDAPNSCKYFFLL